MSKHSECLVYIFGWSGGGRGELLSGFSFMGTAAVHGVECGVRDLRTRCSRTAALPCYANALKFERDWSLQKLRGIRSDSCPLPASELL